MKTWQHENTTQNTATRHKSTKSQKQNINKQHRPSSPPKNQNKGPPVQRLSQRTQTYTQSRPAGPCTNTTSGGTQPPTTHALHKRKSEPSHLGSLGMYHCMPNDFRFRSNRLSLTNARPREERRLTTPSSTPGWSANHANLIVRCFIINRRLLQGAIWRTKRIGALASHRPVAYPTARLGWVDKIKTRATGKNANQLNEVRERQMGNY